MDLPAIPAVNAVTVSATVEQTFPDWFNTLMLVRPALGTGSLKFRPYNHKNKSLYSGEDHDLSVEITDFWAFVEARPTLAQAMGGLVVEFAKVAQERELESLIEAEQKKEEPDLERLSSLQASLNAVVAQFVASE